MGVMLAVRPEYVEKILNCEKTIEIRKSIPKCPLPVKAYIYCTKGKTNQELAFHETIQKYKIYPINNSDILNGKVVAEFTLKEYESINFNDIVKEKAYIEILFNSCLSGMQLKEYLSDKTGFVWYINDLKIYDQPKELSEFRKPKLPLGLEWENIRLARPPQSYAFVEELEEV